METTRTLLLDDGRTLPAIGFGTWPLTGDEATRTVLAALEVGYRLIDTAVRYENEREVGAALRASGVPRRELFVTTKLRGSDHGYAATLRALDESLERLGLEDVDLFLIHWPLPRRKLYVDSWKAMIELREKGRVRSIGVSNFEPEHLQTLIDATGVVPAVNQVELHPEFSQPALRAFHAAHGIVTEAWRPLGKGSALRAPIVESIARKHARTPAQIVLRWEIELGVVAIPKTTSVERMRENLAVFDFTLDEDDRMHLASLDRGARQGGDPNVHEEL
jgi:2,5-diketo-D-gluconate reductase A